MCVCVCFLWKRAYTSHEVKEKKITIYAVDQIGLSMRCIFIYSFIYTHTHMEFFTVDLVVRQRWAVRDTITLDLKKKKNEEKNRSKSLWYDIIDRAVLCSFLFPYYVNQSEKYSHSLTLLKIIFRKKGQAIRRVSSWWYAAGFIRVFIFSYVRNARAVF